MGQILSVGPQGLRPQSLYSPQRCLVSHKEGLGPTSRPNHQGKDEEDPSGSQLRPSAGLAAWDLCFTRQLAGQPAALGFSLSEQKRQCFPHKL